MTAAELAVPPVARRRGGTRVRLAVLVVVALAGIGVLAVSRLDETLVYYRTPTELVNDAGLTGERVRLGGLVQPDGLDKDADEVTFTLTDGTTEVPVVFTGSLGGVFQAGQNALVEGTLGEDGVFRGDQLMVKHTETYQGPDSQAYTPPPLGGEGP
ncbi:MAG: cytochrome c maturation protein CcmE [Jiangellaceae bacterium]